MILTKRLLLRPMQKTDAEDLYQVFSDPAVMQYFDNRHRDIATTRTWVAASVDAPRHETREFVLVQKDRVIGKAGIWKRPELGFLLHRSYWRQGLMREALARLIPYFFTDMALEHITADVDPRNAASLGLLEQLGFKETHRASNTIEIEGAWCDSVYLTLSKTDGKPQGVAQSS
ncbi:MAG: GNAT family N-acetyltransferase [Arenibacterium sp.]